ncbi:MAG: N-acetyltransferase [Deltaproteobacteria bacterium]|nr:N-acetyltransferase [Deltaproteobacteria bacterium]
MIIRNETNADIAAISDVTIAAFQNHPFSRQTEQYIVSALRNAQALCLSLIAEVDGQVAGHIAFSPVTISDGTPDWYGIGPVSVLPELQRQGIGRALIREGLSIMKTRGAQGCALVGDPGYYKRFGFRNIPDLIHEGIPQKFFLVLPFRESTPQGHVVFHKAFQATS